MATAEPAARVVAAGTAAGRLVEGSELAAGAMAAHMAAVTARDEICSLLSMDRTQGLNAISIRSSAAAEQQ